MALRLTKQQKEYQESVLAKHIWGDKFKPSAKILEACMCEIHVLHMKLLDEQAKSLWRIFRERYL